LRKITQDNKADNFKFVPDLNYGERWDDERLFSRYGINAQDALFMRSMIREMQFTE
jgi:site-specific DNA-methyltransferase (adenine-specific)